MRNYQIYLHELENLKISGSKFREINSVEIQKMECIKRLNTINRFNVLKSADITCENSKNYSLALADILQEMLLLTKVEKQFGEKNQTKSHQAFYAHYNYLYDKIHFKLKKLKKCMSDKIEVERLINEAFDDVMPLWCAMREYIVSIDKIGIVEDKEVELSE